MVDLTELIVTENGLTNLDGRIVNAIPVGKPLIMTLLIGEEKNKDRITYRLQRMYNKPETANAYVLGEGLDENHTLVHTTSDMEDHYKAFAVQYYKLNPA